MPCGARTRCIGVSVPRHLQLQPRPRPASPRAAAASPGQVVGALAPGQVVAPSPRDRSWRPHPGTGRGVLTPGQVVAPSPRDGSSATAPPHAVPGREGRGCSAWGAGPRHPATCLGSRVTPSHTPPCSYSLMVLGQFVSIK